MSEDETDDVSPKGNIINYNPTHIVEIEVGDLSAPVAAGVEMSKLFLVSNNILTDLKQDIRRDEETKRLILPPDLLPWMKEARMLLEHISKMTTGIQEKAALKQMDIAGKMFTEYMKSLPPEERIQMIRSLKTSGTR